MYFLLVRTFEEEFERLSASQLLVLLENVIVSKLESSSEYSLGHFRTTSIITYNISDLAKDWEAGDQQNEKKSCSCFQIIPYRLNYKKFS